MGLWEGMGVKSVQVQKFLYNILFLYMYLCSDMTCRFRWLKNRPRICGWKLNMGGKKNKCVPVIEYKSICTNKDYRYIKCLIFILICNNKIYSNVAYIYMYFGPQRLGPTDRGLHLCKFVIFVYLCFNKF
jgi:hypothetical protein